MSKCKNIDIMDVSEAPEYDILYCDPPWEQKMVRFFQTIMRKQTGQEVDNSIDAILFKLGSIANIRKPLFIEYSISGKEKVIEFMEMTGHKHMCTSRHVQGNGKPYVLMQFNTDVFVREGMKGMNLPTEVTRLSGAKVVFDPFAGIGATYQAVEKAGASYIGYELNPARYKRLAERMGK